MSSDGIISFGKMFNFDPVKGSGAVGDAIRVWSLIKSYDPKLDVYKTQTMAQGVWREGQDMLLEAFEEYINQQLGLLYIQNGQGYADRVSTKVTAMPDLYKKGSQ